MGTIIIVHAALHPFAATPPPQPTPTVTCRNRIGWALALTVLAETIVATLAIATGSYLIGLAATSAMALCGLLLVAAETRNVGRCGR